MKLTWQGGQGEGDGREGRRQQGGEGEKEDVEVTSAESFLHRLHSIHTKEHPRTEKRS